MMMGRRRIFLVLAAFAAALLGLALLLYFRPLSSIFNRVFGNTDDVIPTSVDAEVFQRDNASFIEDYPDAEKNVRRCFTLFFTELGADGTSYSDEIEKLYHSTCTDLWRDRLAIFAALSRRDASPSDLGFDRFTLSLRYNGISKISDSILVLNMEVQADIFYNCLNGESSETPITSHTITLKKDGTRWLIFAHEADGWFWDYASNVLDSLYNNDGYNGSDLTYNYIKPYYERARAVVTRDSGFSPSGGTIAASPAEYAYDRSSAVEYALQWARGGYILRNQSFGEYSNDSANFISQCLLAGGIPMDCQGDESSTQWKWYDTDVNLSRAPVGCSPSWYDCDSFYDYCSENNGFGLVSSVDENQESIKTGDVVQFITGESVDFEAIITGFTDDGIPLITAHSPDILNVPLSSVCCERYRFICIYGYNTANI